MSEEVKRFSTGATLGLIFGFYGLSLIVTTPFLYCRINREKTSCIIFIISTIYASLFIFLNISAIFDVFFNSREDLTKFFKFLKRFYLGFTIVDKALGFVLFNILINYLESGYFSKWNKLIDGGRRYIYSFIKMKTCQKVLLFAIGLPIVAALLVLLVIYRKHFDLGYYPWEYTDILLDCYAIFEIYTGVGFFMHLLIHNCRRKIKSKLQIRYYNYSKEKIIEKTEKCLGKIKKSYDHLNKLAPYFENNKTNSYFVYLQEQFKEIKNAKNEFETLKGSSLNNNQNDTNYDNTYTDIEINQNKYDGNVIQNLTTLNGQETQIEVNNKSNIEEIKPLSPNKEDHATNEEIRRYKKAMRRIEKLKLLYAVVKKKSKECLQICNCSCCGFIILLDSFFMAIVTDFFLPLIFNYESDREYYNSDNDPFDQESAANNVGTAIGLMIVGFFYACPYTILTIYTTTRKRYISGDYLYNSKINDDISLMKTVQLVCGYSFAMVYCNLYYWKAVDYKGKLGKPYFYDKIIIPDYVFKQGISIYMIIKIIIIIFSIIAHIKLGDKFVYKNDLAEYYKLGDSSGYDNETEFRGKLVGKEGIIKILDPEYKTSFID